MSSDTRVGTVAVDGSARSYQRADTFSVDAMARVGRCGREVDGWIEMAARSGPVVLVSALVSTSLSLETWLALSSFVVAFPVLPSPLLAPLSPLSVQLLGDFVFYWGLGAE